MKGKHRFRPDMVLSGLVFLSLALPLVPVPGDGATIIDVAYRTENMRRPAKFTTHVSRSICHLMEMALAYEDPETGHYTRVACAD